MKFWMEFCLCSVRALRLRKERELQKPLAFMRNTLSWYISFVLMSSVYGKILNVYYINWNLRLDKYAILLDKIPDKVRQTQTLIQFKELSYKGLQELPIMQQTTLSAGTQHSVLWKVYVLAFYHAILNCWIFHSIHLNSMPVSSSNLELTSGYYTLDTCDFTHLSSLPIHLIKICFIFSVNFFWFCGTLSFYELYFF